MKKTAIVPTLGSIGLMRAGKLEKEVSDKIKETPKGEHKMLLASRAGILTG